MPNITLLKQYKLYANLTLALAWRDVRVRYQLTILGMYWAIINPLLTAIIWSFVFSKIFRATGLGGVPYVVFLFCGLTYWNLFANSVNTAAGILTGNAMLLSKLYFPRIILPTAAVLARLVDFLFSLGVLLLMLWYYNIMPHFNLKILLPLLLIQLIYTLGWAYLVAALNVLYRDVAQLINIILMFWLYLSPIFYVYEQVPARLRHYFAYNTIGVLVDTQRNSVLAGIPPDYYLIGISFLLSLGMLAFGILVFKKLEPLFAEVM